MPSHFKRLIAIWAIVAVVVGAFAASPELLTTGTVMAQRTATAVRPFFVEAGVLDRAPCDGAAAYATALSVSFSSPDGIVFRSFDPADASVMTVGDLRSTEQALRSFASDLQQITPPPAAESMHDDMVRYAILYAEWIKRGPEYAADYPDATGDSAIAFGFTQATLELVDPVSRLQERLTREIDAYAAKCGEA